MQFCNPLLTTQQDGQSKLPRLLLLSEATLSENGGGINRTLLNLFEDYPKDSLCIYSKKVNLQNFPTIEKFRQQLIGFSQFILPSMKNRLAPFFNPLIKAINLQLISSLPVPELKQINKFAPEVILLCTNSIEYLLLGYKLMQKFKIPFIVYAMDDWIDLEKDKWFSGNAKNTVSKLMRKAHAWFLISKQLETVFSKRYATMPKSSLIVNNPVKIGAQKYESKLKSVGKPFRIAYAGSIWPMHYDALQLVASAVTDLSQKGIDIELKIYCDQTFWNTYAAQLSSASVHYGSYISYEDLRSYLKDADLLLVTSSFLPQYEHLTKTSVQTKMTDYMAAGRALLLCGPPGSACNDFANNWNCGIVHETKIIEELKDKLKQAINNPSFLEQLGKNAFDAASQHFEKSLLTKNVYEFIRKLI